jgi:hypothetical protein
MLLKWRILDVFHNLIFVQTHMILEGSAASIIRNKFVRNEANMGHRVGPSKGMQVYVLFSSDDETEPTTENICLSTKTTWYLCVDDGQHICLFTHQLPQDVWWTNYIRGFTVWRVVRQRSPYDSGRSGDRISVEARFSATVPKRPWVPPSPLYNEHRG